MGTSLFLAKLLGLYIIIVGVGVLLNLEFYKQIMEDFCKSPALLYLGGVVALLFGLLIVLVHNVWAANWTVLITIMGWMGLIKGVCLVACPRVMIKMTGAYRGKTLPLVIHLVVIVLFGAILTYMGFFAA